MRVQAAAVGMAQLSLGARAEGVGDGVLEAAELAPAVFRAAHVRRHGLRHGVVGQAGRRGREPGGDAARGGVVTPPGSVARVDALFQGRVADLARALGGGRAR